MGFSLRNVALVVLVLVAFHLGRGLARGLVEGNYVRGVFGLILALAPVLWLLSVVRRAYF
nr:hypothetical protein [Halomicroarcula laminariae]